LGYGATASVTVTVGTTVSTDNANNLFTYH
jgi:hypothetical protein